MGELASIPIIPRFDRILNLDDMDSLTLLGIRNDDEQNSNGHRSIKLLDPTFLRLGYMLSSSERESCDLPNLASFEFSYMLSSNEHTNMSQNKHECGKLPNPPSMKSASCQV